MKKIFLVVGCWILVAGSFGQTVSQKLQNAFKQFEADTQLKHAVSSLYVVDAKTGKVIFDKNSQFGLAPASTQKIITAATAFELLGKDYRYKTVMSYDEKPVEIKKGKLINRIYIEGFGDPCLGSFRFSSENRNQFLDSVLYCIKKAGIDTFDKDISAIVHHFGVNPIPDGWIWQDIGNYYGAGHWSLNWRENQFDIILNSPKKIGDRVTVVRKVPDIPDYHLKDHIKSAQKGSGDNAYVYLPIGDIFGKITGTIPQDEKSFKVSGAMPNPPYCLVDSLRKFLIRNGVVVKEKSSVALIQDPEYFKIEITGKQLYTHYSPSLDSIIYWFLKKSINLYGEALIKTFAYEKKGFGSMDTGVVIVKDFWKQKGIDEDELNLYDGSGLSPLNRVTTHAQVGILKYAKTRSWFSYFYNSLPEYNDMKMKSGTISDVKGFCGYHKAKDGNEYIFSFLVNNYSGTSSAVVSKMYKVLNVLK